MYKVPEDSALFTEVAFIIGEEGARKQLDIAAPTFTDRDIRDIEEGSGIEEAFVWDKTPQGRSFWSAINDEFNS